MIRVGMNKKTGEPVNLDHPFYYMKDSIYTPCRSINITGTSQIHYGESKPGSNKKIVWLETTGNVSENITDRFFKTKITVNEKAIISNNIDVTDLDVCTIQKGSINISSKSCMILGKCNLIFDMSQKETVFIETDSEVVLL